VPGNTRFYIVLTKPTSSEVGGATRGGSVPASNSGGAVSSYEGAPAPSVQELRELLELKQELNQMSQQQQKAQITQTSAAQQ
jgi:hypothetical protein